MRRTNVDATVDVEDLEKWESEFGLIPEGAVIIMYSGGYSLGTQ